MKSKSQSKDKQQHLTENREYQRALDLAEAGDHQQALDILQEYLVSWPQDSEALNDTGVILHCLGRTDQAIVHLVKARDLQPDSGEIAWNLCEAYLSAGEPEKAKQLFEQMEQLGVLNIDVLNRTANEFLNNEDLPKAAQLLERSLQIEPEQEILTSMIEVIHSKMPACNETN